MPADATAVRRIREAQEVFYAAHSEPSGEFRMILREALNGQPFRARTIRGWELYSADNLGRPGSGNAKNHLNRTAREAHRLVKKYRHVALVQEWIGW